MMVYDINCHITSMQPLLGSGNLLFKRKTFLSRPSSRSSVESAMTEGHLTEFLEVDHTGAGSDLNQIRTLAFDDSGIGSH